MAATLALALAGGRAAGQEGCGLCNDRVVINSELAACFLEQYGSLSQRSSPAIFVDLTTCSSRGVVEPLAPPILGAPEPEEKFVLSRTQLDCLKRKLEEPGVVLDPSATIPLDSCG